MKTEDLRTLRLLEEIERASSPSQRDLAARLGVSLGLVNSFVRRLAAKGYFKITTLPKNRARYILTPKGAAEKARLTLEYFQYSLRFYKDARASARRVLAGLAGEGVRRVAFFGAGDLAEIVYVSLKETPLTLAGVVDLSGAGKKFLGMEVKGLADLAAMAPDRVLVMSPDTVAARQALEESGIPPARLVWLISGEG
ncbi:MAG: winged helix-turn-helix transcriptional regulator [Proteobacteria bacterium]|nr:winged helix-turn-helix transcriptional regulator [Pseudomonadota bacterium]